MSSPLSVWLQEPIKVILLIVISVLCLFGVINASVALVLGIVLSLLGWVPQALPLKRWLKFLLSASIVGLGFGIDLKAAISSSLSYLPLLLIFITVTLCLAIILSRVFRVHLVTSTLVGSGTAICGGSAIAAVSPVVQASATQMALALGAVSILNAVALWLFPWVGSVLNMTQEQFGVWAAVAIHDTSSVVAAAQIYGDEALELATTLKLTRAMMIAPMAIVISLWFARYQQKQHGGQAQTSKTKVKIPGFILLYVLAMFIAFLLPQLGGVYQGVFDIAKRVLVLCLFLVGCGLNIQTLKQGGLNVLLLATSLWIVVGSAALYWVLHFV